MGFTTGDNDDDDDIDDDKQNNDRPSIMPRGVHTRIQEINSPQELADFLYQDDDRICVIKFHASWCKSCQRMGLKFQNFVNQHGDWIQGQARYSDCDEREVLREGRYRFASIEQGANAGIFKELQVNRLPFVHLYADGKQLAGFPCGATRFYNLREHLDVHEQERTGKPTASGSSFAVAKTTTTFTPELLNKIIAMDAKGELKSARKTAL